jgi:hypothetical protein
MMGHRQVEQAALFYEFSLERQIPADLSFPEIISARIHGAVRPGLG